MTGMARGYRTHGTLHLIPDPDFFYWLGSTFGPADRFHLIEFELNQYTGNNNWLETCQFFRVSSDELLHQPD